MSILRNAAPVDRRAHRVPRGLVNGFALAHCDEGKLRWVWVQVAFLVAGAGSRENY